MHRLMETLLSKIVQKIFLRKHQLGGFHIVYDSSCTVKLDGDIQLSSNINLAKNCVLVVESGGFLRLGCGIIFSRGVLIEVPTRCNLTIGNEVKLGANSELHGDISIGSYTLIAPQVFATSGSHNYPRVDQSIRELDQISPIASKPIQIGESCWICRNVHILPGKSIGSFSVIGADIIISQNIPPFSKVRLIQNLEFSAISNTIS
jgi:carbonic anhydrase/acetyltransferase-like protein (isoleucine patch superfamily)